jgi:hypothetical protein
VARGFYPAPTLVTRFPHRLPGPAEQGGCGFSQGKFSGRVRSPGILPGSRTAYPVPMPLTRHLPDSQDLLVTTRDFRKATGNPSWVGGPGILPGSHLGYPAPTPPTRFPHHLPGPALGSWPWIFARQILQLGREPGNFTRFPPRLPGSHTAYPAPGNGIFHQVNVVCQAG